MSATPTGRIRPVTGTGDPRGRLLVALASLALLGPVGGTDAAVPGGAPNTPDAHAKGAKAPAPRPKVPARPARPKPARPARPGRLPARPARLPARPARLPARPAPPRPAASPSAVEVIVQMTNEARLSNGLAPLRVDERLSRAAQHQANAMAGLERLAHELPGAALPTPASRLAAVGYDPAWWGENIGYGFDAATMCASWANSPPHRANLLGPAMTEIGVAVAHSPRGVPYYCQVFGCPR